MNTRSLALVFVSLMLGGCATSGDHPSSRIPAGEITFKAYSDVNHKVNAGCDVYTNAELTESDSEATLTLRSAVSGMCHMMPAQDERTYTLRRNGAQEGEKKYVSTKVSVKSPGVRKFKSAVLEEFQMKGASSTTIIETDEHGVQTALHRAD